MVQVSLAKSRAAVARVATGSGPVASPLRAFSRMRPKVVAIGASTGGPQALATLLQALTPHLDSVPVLLVLHMPADFTGLIAQHLHMVTGRICEPATHGQVALPGRIYVAPGQTHLRAKRAGDCIRLEHHEGAPENFCRPAVDVLFRSVAECWGPAALGLVLTGMGVDGVAGSRAIVEAGGSIIAQDEASSAVWGMPGAVVRGKLAAAVLSIDDIAPFVGQMLEGRRGEACK
jgi:two-component system chemotaxis response regulator CheB